MFKISISGNRKADQIS